MFKVMMFKSAKNYIIKIYCFFFLSDVPISLSRKREEAKFPYFVLSVLQNLIIPCMLNSFPVTVY